MESAIQELTEELVGQPRFRYFNTSPFGIWNGLSRNVGVLQEGFGTGVRIKL
jgi:hypothetical protein